MSICTDTFSVVPIGEIGEKKLQLRSCHSPTDWKTLERILKKPCWQPLNLTVPNFVKVQSIHKTFKKDQKFCLVRDERVREVSSSIHWVVRVEDVPGKCDPLA